MTLDTLFVFLPISLLLILAPGPDSILVLTRGITMGRRAAIISATGVSIGLVCHSLFAAAGLSAIVQRSAAAFSIVKYLGAAYFLFLGVRALLGRGETDFSASARTGIGTGRIFIQGMLPTFSIPRSSSFSWRTCPSSLRRGPGILPWSCWRSDCCSRASPGRF